VVGASSQGASVDTAAPTVASADNVLATPALVYIAEAGGLSAAGDENVVGLCTPAVAVSSEVVSRLGAVVVLGVITSSELVVMLMETVGIVGATVLFADTDRILCAFSSASLAPVAVIHSSEKVAS